MDFDLEDDGAEPVSDAEIAKVLAGILRPTKNVASTRVAPRKPPAPSRPVALAPTSTPCRPPASARATDRLVERAHSYDVATVAAKQQGDKEIALKWLRRGKALQAAAEMVLSDFPDPSAGPPPDTEEGGSCSSETKQGHAAVGPVVPSTSLPTIMLSVASQTEPVWAHACPDAAQPAALINIATHASEMAPCAMRATQPVEMSNSPVRGTPPTQPLAARQSNKVGAGPPKTQRPTDEELIASIAATAIVEDIAAARARDKQVDGPLSTTSFQAADNPALVSGERDVLNIGKGSSIRGVDAHEDENLSTEDDAFLMAEEYAAQIVSHSVLAWEISLVSDTPADCDQLSAESEAAECKKESLELRKELLEAEVSSGRLQMGTYLERLRAAIVEEKKMAMAFKAQGKTRDAVHSLKRAKLMTEEIAEVEASPEGT